MKNKIYRINFAAHQSLFAADLTREEIEKIQLIKRRKIFDISAKPSIAPFYRADEQFAEIYNLIEKKMFTLHDL
jgi:pantoate kinase